MEHTFESEMGSIKQTAPRGTGVTYTSTTIVAGTPLGTYTATPVAFTASTAEDANMIRIWNTQGLNSSGARGDVVIDIMTGAAGSEVPIIPGLLFGGRSTYSSYTLPIYIPAGTRISGRTAAGQASRSVTWCVDLWRSQALDRGPNKWASYGVTVTSNVGAYGTLVTAGANTWGSWTALTTNTTYAHDLWVPMTAVASGTAITAVSWRNQFAIASTTDAATMVTNGTGVFEGMWFTGSTTEYFGQYPTATNAVHVGIQDIIYAPRAAGASVSTRAYCASGAIDSNILSSAILAAVK